MQLITDEDRRRRLGRRHWLAESSDSLVGVAGDLVGIHASDPGSVYLAARARLSDAKPDDIASVLYDDRDLVRMHGMRRTMWVLPLDVAAVMNAACTRALIPKERTRLAGWLEDHGHAEDGQAWIDRVGADVVTALDDRGPSVATEIAEDVPELGLKLELPAGRGKTTQVGVSTRILYVLALEARIARARPRGTWISSQYRWVGFERWFGASLHDHDDEPARHELIRRWLTTFGPATQDDLTWWSGLAVRVVKASLAALDAVEVELSNGTGWLLPDDLEPVEDPEPWVALLPGLDPTTMGWKDRDWYLDPAHVDRLFDRNGNAGPTVWADGRVIGGWAQRPSGEVVVDLLADVGNPTVAAVEAEAERLASWLGDTRVVPRFRSPLEKDLSTG